MSAYETYYMDTKFGVDEIYETYAKYISTGNELLSKDLVTF